MNDAFVNHPPPNQNYLANLNSHSTGDTPSLVVNLYVILVANL